MNRPQIKFFIQVKWCIFFRVWDKVISGSCKILVFVALEILLSYKVVLLGISRPEGVVKFLCNVSKSQHNTLIAHNKDMHCHHSKNSQQLSPSRYRKKTQTPSWAKPLTCGTNTAVPQYTLCNQTELHRHLSCFPKMQQDWQTVPCQRGFVSAWLNWKIITDYFPAWETILSRCESRKRQQSFNLFCF